MREALFDEAFAKVNSKGTIKYSKNQMNESIDNCEINLGLGMR